MYARAFAVLLGAAGLPLLWRRPQVDETRIGGIETSIFSPKGGGPRPAIVLMNGATPSSPRWRTRISASPRALADLGRIAAALGRTLRRAKVGYTDGRRGAPPRVSTS